MSNDLIAGRGILCLLEHPQRTDATNVPFGIESFDWVQVSVYIALTNDFFKH
jgi:hypothetical protein